MSINKFVNSIGLFNFAVISICAGAAIHMLIKVVYNSLSPSLEYDDYPEIIILSEDDLKDYTKEEIKALLKKITTPDDIVRFKQQKLIED